MTLSQTRRLRLLTTPLADGSWSRPYRADNLYASPFDGQKRINYTLSQNQIQARICDHWIG